MTVTVGRIKRTLNRKLRGYEPKTFIEPGVTGDYDGNVDAGANRSYVRVRGMVTIAHNQVAGETSNTPVWVGYTKENDRLYQVTGVTARGGVDMPWSMTMGKHRERHEWPTGDDIPWLSIEQIRNLRVYPVAGTVTVRVNPGMSEGVDEWAQVFRLAALDLSGDIPGAGALWALVYIDNTNAVTYTLGDAADSLDLLTSAYIPQTPSGGYALAAVRLYDGQTEIIESAYPPNNDIIDLRFANQGAALRRDFLNQLAYVEAELDFDISMLVRPPAFETGTDRTDYVRLDSNYGLILYGDATNWRDELQNLIGQRLESPGSDITQNSAESSVTYSDSATLVDYLTMNVQLNHDWKIGSDIYPHLHWWQASSDVPNWLIQYRWQINGAAKETTWTNAPYTEHEYAYTAGTLNQLTSFGAISAPEGAGLSDIVQFRIIRDTDNDSEEFEDTDPLAGDVDAMNFDVHIEVDSLGSRSVLAN